MASPVQLLGQVAAYGLFALCLGVFSVAPAYSPLGAEGGAVVVLSLGHSGQRLAECRERTAEELARLPPNMRNPLDCSRERSPIEVRFAVDGEVRYQRSIRATGFSSDGTAYVYAKIRLPAGPHTLDLSLNDDVHRAGRVIEHSAVVDLRPYQVLVIDFDAATGFRLQ
ncbi:MAG: hypothetical protein ABR553_06380 [Gammaproteobacteria bacterium]